MILVVLVCICSSAQVQDDTSPPDALLALGQAVMRARTAQIEWSVEHEGGNSDGEENFFSTRIAGDTRIRTERGTAKGRRYGIRGQPGSFYTPEVRYTFVSPQQSFTRGELATLANRYVDESPEATLDDVRTAGLTLRRWRGSVQDVLWGTPRNERDRHMPRRYTSEVVDGLHVVTGLDDHGYGMRWWIDPEKGWHATRVQELRDGEVFAEATVTLKQWGDFWFPEKVVGPFTTVIVYAASFDQADHAQELTPADIGVDVGMGIGQKGAPGYLFWDGHGTIGVDEYVAKVKSGELVIAPSVKEVWAKQHIKRKIDANPVPADTVAQRQARGAETDIVRVRKFDSQWEAYTRRFIARYALNKSQSDKALGILKNCQNQGLRYLARNRNKLEKLEKRSAELRKADATGNAGQLSKISEQLARLAQPLDDIFEKQLKPRLDKLPTRAQRKATDGAMKAGAKKVGARKPASP